MNTPTTRPLLPPTPPPPPPPAISFVAPTTFSERTLILGNRHVVRFTVESIPDPPFVSFANNLPRLNSMWDDTTPHWCGMSPLVIGGHPIAVVYWPDVYKYGKKDQWKGTKAKWFEWKVL
jgi:hypothetical protein